MPDESSWAVKKDQPWGYLFFASCLAGYVGIQLNSAKSRPAAESSWKAAVPSPLVVVAFSGLLFFATRPISNTTAAESWTQRNLSNALVVNKGEAIGLIALGVYGLWWSSKERK